MMTIVMTKVPGHTAAPPRIQFEAAPLYGKPFTFCLYRDPGPDE